MKKITTSDSSFALTLNNFYPLPDIKFNGHCLINSNNDPLLGAVTLYICCTIDRWSSYWKTDFTLGNCFFGSVKLTKDADPDKYKYSSYGMGFDSRSQFSFTDESMGKNVIIFGVDMSSSVHFDNKGKDIFIPCEDISQGLDDTILTAEAKYSINFTQSNRRFLLSLHYNGRDSFLFVNATKIYQDSEVKKYPLFWVNVSKDFAINNMKKQD